MCSHLLMIFAPHPFVFIWIICSLWNCGLVAISTYIIWNVCRFSVMDFGRRCYSYMLCQQPKNVLTWFGQLCLQKVKKKKQQKNEIPAILQTTNVQIPRRWFSLLQFESFFIKRWFISTCQNNWQQNKCCRNVFIYITKV